MDELEELSYQELINEVNDCMSLMKGIANSPKVVSGIVPLAFLPYLALICSGIQEYEGNDLSAPIIAGKNTAEIIKSIRLKAKLYSSDKSRKSINRILKSISQSTVDMTKGYNSIQLLFIKLFGQENLGVFTFNNIMFFNNMQGYEFVTELYSLDEDSDTSLIEGKDISDFAKYCSSYVTAFYECNRKNSGLNSNGLESIFPSIHEKEISSKDYHFTMGGNNKLLSENVTPEVGIFLLNIYCAINFVVFVLPNILKENSNLYNRILLVCYISSIESLSQLVKNKHYLEGIPDDYIKLFNALVDKKRNLISLELRCNIFHFIIKAYSIVEGDNEIKSIYNSTNSKDFSILKQTIFEELSKIQMAINAIVYLQNH